MDEILAKLDVVIRDVESKAIVVGMTGPTDGAAALLERLLQGKDHLVKARAAYRRARVLIKQGHGELVQRKVEGDGSGRGRLGG